MAMAMDSLAKTTTMINRCNSSQASLYLFKMKETFCLVSLVAKEMPNLVEAFFPVGHQVGYPGIIGFRLFDWLTPLNHWFR